MDPQTLARCARCIAGLCGHPKCDTPDHARHAVTDVAGTSACGDCAGPLLELVLHPLRVVDWTTGIVHGPGGNSGP